MSWMRYDLHVLQGILRGINQQGIDHRAFTGTGTYLVLSRVRGN